MRFARLDVRGHIVSYQNNHRPSYWSRKALRQQERPKIHLGAIFGVVRFSTFATKSARLRHAGDRFGMSAYREDRKWPPERKKDCARALWGTCGGGNSSNL